VSVAEPASQSGARVEADGVRREHPGGIVAVDDVSLTLEAGEFVVLTGPSGSGKTSLLSLLGALDRPTAGRVLVDGAALDGGSDERARYHREVVGFVFQHHHLLAHLPACANVELPLLGGENLSLREVFAIVARAAGRRPPRIGVPWALAYGAARACDAALHLVGREPSLLVLDEVRLARLPMTFDDARARRELGYTSRPAEQALVAAAGAALAGRDC
jgi:putative ABC transport system ATP-binding protein